MGIKFFNWSSKEMFCFLSFVLAFIAYFPVLVWFFRGFGLGFLGVFELWVSAFVCFAWCVSVVASSLLIYDLVINNLED